jgi:hypothetical protein
VLQQELNRLDRDILEFIGDDVDLVRELGEEAPVVVAPWKLLAQTWVAGASVSGQ